MIEINSKLLTALRQATPQEALRVYFELEHTPVSSYFAHGMIAIDRYDAADVVALWDARQAGNIRDALITLDKPIPREFVVWSSTTRKYQNFDMVRWDNEVFKELERQRLAA